MKLSLEFVVAAMSAQILSCKKDSFHGVGSDTRKNLEGQIFFALKGDRFDAHRFVSQAVQQKAAALVVHEWPAEYKKFENEVTVLKVADTLKALQDLARAHRRQSKALVIGITGSNGKTTSKEFTAAVLEPYRRIHFSKGSFNNHWGVPFTLLEEPEGTEVTICEMGMNHAGEIALLAKINEPDIVCCTVVGTAHIENFGHIKGIAAAKEEIYEHSPAQAQRIYNIDNPWTLKMFEKAKQKLTSSKRLWTFSEKDSSADVFLKVKAVTMKSLIVDGKIAGRSGQAELSIFGVQNITNVMVAACNGLAVGLTADQIWESLPRCKTSWGRNQFLQTESGAEILFDGYNANPDSMKALISNLSLIKNSGKKIGIFAEMKELGELAESAHRELGEMVADSGFDYVWFYGPSARFFEEGFRAQKKNKENAKTLMISNDYEDSLASQLSSVLELGDCVLIKGSRGMKLERVVLAFKALNFSLNKE
jgi:UDP-N-acetylmuramoyl-tripeptide--D-alanyl-D-alanine ligase